MRNIWLFKACLLILTHLNGYAQEKGSVSIESDPDAIALLRKVSKKIEATSGLKVDFSLQVELPESENVRYQGNLRQSGEKFHLSLDHYAMICDGTTLWTHMKDINEVHISNAADLDETESFTPNGLFRIYEDDKFEYSLLEERRDSGQQLTVIECKPTDRYADIFKIRLTIDRNELSPVKIISFLKDGTRYIATIETFVTDIDFGESVFHFDPKSYPGIHIEDLRY